MDILIVFRQVIAVLYETNQAIPPEVCLAINHRYDNPAQFDHGNTICPACHSKAPVYSTCEAEGQIQVRFHRCPACHGTFKSVGPVRESSRKPDAVTKQQPLPQNKDKRGKRR